MIKKYPAKDINQYFPIWKIESERGLMISKMGDITVSYKLRLPEIFTMSLAEYELLHGAFVKGIQNLPKYSLLHKQDWYWLEKYNPEFSVGNDFLSHANKLHFFERPYMHHECYLYLTKYSSERAKTGSISTILSKGRIVPKDLLDEKGLSAFLDKVDQLVKILASTGLVSYESLSAKDIPKLLEKYISLSGHGDGLLRDIDFSNETLTGLSVGEKYCQLFTLADLDALPDHLQVTSKYAPYTTDQIRFPLGYTAPLGLLLPYDHILNQYVFVDDLKKIASEFEQKKRTLRSLSLYSRANRNHYEDHIDFLNQVTSGGLPVRSHTNVLVWTDQARLIPEIRNHSSSNISQLNCKPQQSTIDLPILYWAGIPGNGADLPREDTFHTFSEQAACLFNLETNYYSSKSPFGIQFSDRLSLKPVYADLTDEPMQRGIIKNLNAIVIGSSGTGKSFTLNDLMRQFYFNGAHEVIVDIGGSYKGLCALLGGVYYEYLEDKPISFNPFWVKSNKPSVEKINVLKILLQTLWKDESKQEITTRFEDVILQTALSLYYKHLDNHPQIFAGFDSFYEFMKEGFKDYLVSEQVTIKDFNLQTFLQVLLPYYSKSKLNEGKINPLGLLLNAKENLDLVNEPFVVFELDNIKDDPIIFSVTALMVMETFIAKMRTLKGIRKIILIEEAWKAISNQGMAEYMVYLFKTVRKFNGMAMIATQDLDDILKSEIIRETIVSNADIKILLEQKQENLPKLQEALGLSEKEIMLVSSINKHLQSHLKYKEVFISLGGKESKVYAVEVSREAYYAYTSKQEEKMKVFDKVEQEGKSVQRAIDELVKEELSS